MAVLRIQENIQSADGTYDVVHKETEASLVLFDDNETLQQKYDAGKLNGGRTKTWGELAGYINLDMDEATTLAGKLGVFDYNSPVVDTYRFAVSRLDITCGEDGTYYVEGDIYTAKNALGDRTATIILPDGTEYVGQTGKVQLPITGYTGDNSSGTITVVVRSEDGGSTATYVFKLDVTGLERVWVNETTANRYAEKAYVMDENGQVQEVVRSLETVKKEIADLQNEQAALDAEIAAAGGTATTAQNQRKNILTARINSLKEERAFYFQTNKAGKYVDANGDELNVTGLSGDDLIAKLEADGVACTRAVYYSFLTSTAANNRRPGRSGYQGSARAKELTSKMGMGTVNASTGKPITGQGSIKWITQAGIRQDQNTNTYYSVNLYSERNTLRRNVNYFRTYDQNSWEYVRFLPEQAVDSIYMAVEAQDGSITYYLLQMRNADTENRNLNYSSWTENGQETEGYEIWAYANGTEGLSDHSLNPNAKVVYRTANDVKTTDPNLAQMLSTTLDGNTITVPEPWSYRAVKDTSGNDTVDDNGKKVPLWQDVYDTDGNVISKQVVPTYFRAVIDESITQVVIRAKAEFYYSGVGLSIADDSIPAFDRGVHEETVTINADDDTTVVYINVCNQNELLLNQPATMKPWVYTLELERATVEEPNVPL